MRRGPIVPARTVRTYTDATRITDAKLGDIGVCATDGKVGAAIRFLTGGWCNHAFVVVGFAASGLPIVSQETPGGGDVLTVINEVGITRLTLASLDASTEQLAAVVAFANWSGGAKYGFAACVGDLVGEALHVEVDLGIRDHMNCSAQATYAASRTSYIPSKAPEAMRPIDLARDLGVPKWLGAGTRATLAAR